MSTHPNAILKAQIIPDDLPSKTYRAIVADAGRDPMEESPQIAIADDKYHIQLMDAEYDEDMQIGAPSGSIIVYDLVTYGYGEEIAWAKLLEQEKRLEEWLIAVCEKHKCSFEIFITANYW